VAWPENEKEKAAFSGFHMLFWLVISTALLHSFWLALVQHFGQEILTSNSSCQYVNSKFCHK